VLEARDRLGGRIWTSRAWQGLSVDLGANWIEGVRGNPVAELARQAGAATVVSDEDRATLFDHDGRELTDTEVEAVEDDYEALMEDVERLGRRRRRARAPDPSLGTGITEALARSPRSPDALRRLRCAVTTTIEHEYAEDTGGLSLYHWDDDESYGGDDVLLPGGYAQVTDHLARGLSVRTSHVVERVAWGASGVTVTVTGRGDFFAPCAVCTLPLGVLKAGGVTFDPALPPRKRQALSALGVGVLDKLVLRFPQAFWQRSGAELLAYASATPGEWAESYDLAGVLGQPILMLFNAGSVARAFEQETDAQVVDRAMVVLRRIFGAAIPAPTGQLVTRWGQDPFALGSYSHLPPGASLDDVDALAQALDGALFFAGEATDHYSATVHGAVRSGRRAAQEVLRR
jgi:monoamine oxidase